MRRTNQRLIYLMAFVGSLAVEATVMTTSALASIPSQSPILLAQRANQQIATLQCGQFTIAIRYDGPPGDRFTYQTRGLFLRGGQMDGSDYIFYNSDYEYRVTVNTVNQYDTSGNGRLQVFHYGEPIVDKSCTWEN